MVNRISVTQAASLIDEEEVTVVDIRDVNSFNQGHIKSAVRLDNTNITSFLEQADKSKPILVFCYHGNSSQSAAAMFEQQGFAQSYSVDGGMSEWSLVNKVESND